MKAINFVCQDFRQGELADDVTDYHVTTLETQYPLQEDAGEEGESMTSSAGYDSLVDRSFGSHPGGPADQARRDALNAAMTTCGLPVSSTSGSVHFSTMTSPQSARACLGRADAAGTPTSPGEVSGGRGAGYDNVMVWLNQQSCGGTVKRKRRINRRQRLAANQRERRRMVSMNSAFEALRQTIPTLPYEKKLSRIQTLRLAMDYINVMSDILQGPATHPGGAGSTDTNLSAGNASMHVPTSHQTHMAAGSLQYW